MSRPRKYKDGAVRFCITVSPEVAEAIKNNPNRSAYIDSLIKLDLSMNTTAQIDAKLVELNDTVYSLEKDRLIAQKEINTLEAQKNALTRMNGDSMNARLKIVESFVSKRATETDIRGWFESRTDKLGECGFTTPEEATEWMKKKMVR